RAQVAVGVRERLGLDPASPEPQVAERAEWVAPVEAADHRLLDLVLRAPPVESPRLSEQGNARAHFVERMADDVDRRLLAVAQIVAPQGVSHVGIEPQAARKLSTIARGERPGPWNKPSRACSATTCRPPVWMAARAATSTSTTRRAPRGWRTAGRRSKPSCPSTTARPATT